MVGPACGVPISPSGRPVGSSVDHHPRAHPDLRVGLVWTCEGYGEDAASATMQAVRRPPPDPGEGAAASLSTIGRLARRLDGRRTRVRRTLRSTRRARRLRPGTSRPIRRWADCTRRSAPSCLPPRAPSASCGECAKRCDRRRPPKSDVHPHSNRGCDPGSGASPERGMWGCCGLGLRAWTVWVCTARGARRFSSATAALQAGGASWPEHNAPPALDCGRGFVVLSRRRGQTGGAAARPAANPRAGWRRATAA